MDTKRHSMVSGAALLALTATASAGPMSVASSQVVTPPLAVEQVHYYRHHYRHHGWYHHRHYGWHHHRYYHRYGWNPAAAVAGTALGLATLPFALAGGGYYYGYPYYGYPYYYQ